MSRPSPLFLAALDARAAIEKLEGKLTNIRRELSRSERYALDLVLDAAENVEDRYARKTEAQAGR